MNKLLKTLLAGVALSSMLAVSGVQAGERIGQVETSGLFFKDKINIEVFDDPTIKGISCYVNLPDKVGSWEDQSDTALSCGKTGPISGDIKSQADLFRKSKGLFFKTMRVDRFYDPKRNTLSYISYTQKTSGDNAGSGLSVVFLNDK